MLMKAAEPSTSVKSVVGAGSYVLCLGKDELTMRKMDRNMLENPIAQLKINASQICFDNAEKEQRCYAIKNSEKSTKVTRFKVYQDGLVKEASFDVPGSFNRCQARNGELLLAGLNDLVLLSAAEKDSDMATKCSRHFDNLAVRDIALGDNSILMTAIDKDTKGFFLVLSKEAGEAGTKGSIDLPHDGVALAVQGTKAVAVGRTQEGKDVATVVSFSQESAPQVTSTLPVLDGVSSVSLNGQLAILAGRGLEIVNL